MPKNISCISSKSNDATMSSVRSALNDALDCIDTDGAFENGKKVLILALDDTNENFDVTFIQAGMKMSECISLIEVAKTQFLNSMGYIPDD